jgi:hypothetical protein
MPSWRDEPAASFIPAGRLIVVFTVLGVVGAMLPIGSVGAKRS